MMVGKFVTAANEVTIGGFWRENAKGELKTRKNHEILRFISPCWEKRYMGRVFYAEDAIFDAFLQELTSDWPFTWSTPGICSTWAQPTCSVGVWKRSELMDT